MSPHRTLIASAALFAVLATPAFAQRGTQPPNATPPSTSTPTPAVATATVTPTPTVPVEGLQVTPLPTWTPWPTWAPTETPTPEATDVPTEEPTPTTPPPLPPCVPGGPVPCGVK